MVSIIAQQRELYLSIYRDLYTDVAEKLRVPVKESRRDLLTIANRVEREGLGFLTKTLPQLRKALDKALSKDEPFSIPSTFKKSKGRTTPCLFGWLFSRVITPEGLVVPQVDTELIASLRQLMDVFYKLEIAYTEDQEKILLDQFVQVDAALDKGSNVDQEWIEETSDLIRDIFASFDPADIVPRHGPGSVATGELNHEKHRFKRIYSEIEKVYPFTEYYSYSMSAVADQWRQYEDLESLKSGTAKVVLVPKDSRGPRIISCEPLEYQWIQQGLGRAITAHLERSHITRGHVNFTDQTINGDLALQSSKTQKWVTLDMKEASDRVSCWLVSELFAKVPALRDALFATRSTHTRLPSGQVVHLKKFAPMGSCLCFPVEALVFYALAVTSIIRTLRAEHPNRSARSLRHSALHAVYVYGDDLIVRSKDYASVLQALPTVGLLFNDAKCCTAGFFRESCGVDAYNGVNVTPLRIKKVYECHRNVRAETYVAYVAYSNAMYARGYKRVASHLASLVESRIGPLPITYQQEGYLSLIRPVRTIQPGPRSPIRYNVDWARWEIRAWTLFTPSIEVESNDWSMILRRFTSPSDWSDPGTFAVPRRSRLHRGWSSLV
jgi:hypothetical protein